ncbi:MULTISPECIES: hypothetical protein [Nostocales]|uniref:Uncharacterized protein n=3 Tax=Nostocales TaxID=1161 RepID=A0A8S9T1E4_9CYAN|nr:hypothetical protein [Tolypothrix bouteillei]KAF3885382.1 hypothetical protein DA73_0400007860 [Tolypothrix bouteillei VB521301]
MSCTPLQTSGTVAKFVRWRSLRQVIYKIIHRLGSAFTLLDLMLKYMPANWV